MLEREHEIRQTRDRDTQWSRAQATLPELLSLFSGTYTPAPHWVSHWLYRTDARKEIIPNYICFMSHKINWSEYWGLGENDDVLLITHYIIHVGLKTANKAIGGEILLPQLSQSDFTE